MTTTDFNIPEPTLEDLALDLEAIHKFCDDWALPWWPDVDSDGPGPDADWAWTGKFLTSGPTRTTTGWDGAAAVRLYEDLKALGAVEKMSKLVPAILRRLAHAEREVARLRELDEARRECERLAAARIDELEQAVSELNSFDAPAELIRERQARDLALKEVERLGAALALSARSSQPEAPRSVAPLTMERVAAAMEKRIEVYREAAMHHQKQWERAKALPESDPDRTGKLWNETRLRDACRLRVESMEDVRGAAIKAFGEPSASTPPPPEEGKA